jgi:hypothetical protein
VRLLTELEMKSTLTDVQKRLAKEMPAAASPPPASPPAPANPVSFHQGELF